MPDIGWKDRQPPRHRRHHPARREVQPQRGIGNAEQQLAGIAVRSANLGRHRDIECRTEPSRVMNMADMKALRRQSHRPGPGHGDFAGQAPQKRVACIGHQASKPRLDGGNKRILQRQQHWIGSGEQAAARLGAAAQRLIGRRAQHLVPRAERFGKIGKELGKICPAGRGFDLVSDDKSIVIDQPGLTRIIGQPPDQRQQRPWRLVQRGQTRGRKRVLLGLLRRAGLQEQPCQGGFGRA